MVELGGVPDGPAALNIVPDGPAALNVEINICKNSVDININRMNIHKSSFLGDMTASMSPQKTTSCSRQSLDQFVFVLQYQDTDNSCKGSPPFRKVQFF